MPRRPEAKGKDFDLYDSVEDIIVDLCAPVAALASKLLLNMHCNRIMSGAHPKKLLWWVVLKFVELGAEYRAVRIQLPKVQSCTNRY